jgi:hypothetical protein
VFFVVSCGGLRGDCGHLMDISLTTKDAPRIRDLFFGFPVLGTSVGAGIPGHCGILKS